MAWLQGSDAELVEGLADSLQQFDELAAIELPDVTIDEIPFEFSSELLNLVHQHGSVSRKAVPDVVSELREQVEELTLRAEKAEETLRFDEPLVDC